MFAEISFADFINWLVIPTLGLIWWQMREIAFVKQETNNLEKKLIAAMARLEAYWSARLEDRILQKEETSNLRSAMEKLTSKIELLQEAIRGKNR